MNQSPQCSRLVSTFTKFKQKRTTKISYNTGSLCTTCRSYCSDLIMDLFGRMAKKVSPCSSMISLLVVRKEQNNIFAWCHDIKTKIDSSFIHQFKIACINSFESSIGRQRTARTRQTRRITIQRHDT
jgi:hypothetical protein